MIKVLFICHGNICRSPMAEFVLKDMVKRIGAENEFYIESSATSREEIGNDMYPPAKKLLRRKGIPFSARAARQFTKEDYSRFDYIFIMERYNLPNLKRIIGDDIDDKVHFFTEYTNLQKDIADPWYTGDFETTYEQVVSCSKAFLEHLEYIK